METIAFIGMGNMARAIAQGFLAGGAVQAHFAVGAATLGISGLPLAGATDHILIYLFGVAVAYVAGFAATWILGFDDPEEEMGEKDM